MSGQHASGLLHADTTHADSARHPAGFPHADAAPLAPGDVVWLIAPSGPVPAHLTDAAVAALTDWGLEVRCGRHLRGVDERADYLAGSDAMRRADLMTAWTDPQAAAVIAIRGGYGAMRLLDGLDWPALAAASRRTDGRPKLLTGSSDVTALHEAFAAQLGVAGLFSPMPGNAVFAASEAIRTDVHRWLFEPWAGQPVALGTQAATLVPGTCTGITYGGNLSLLSAGIGSRTGHAMLAAPGILILEDVDEDVYRLDGMLLQLARAGWFERAGAIVLGSWIDCGPEAAREAMLAEYFAESRIPVIWRTDIGHHPHACSVPLGVPAVLTAPAAGTAPDPAHTSGTAADRAHTSGTAADPAHTSGTAGGPSLRIARAADIGRNP